MGAPQQIDYDALAKQYGATSSQPPAVDYDALAKQYGATSSTPPQPKISAPPAMFSKAWWKEKLYNTADVAAEALPAVGGTVGAIAGGGAGILGGGVSSIPGAIAGATLGGGAGEAARQLVRRAAGFSGAPDSSADAAKQIALQGGIQGAIQGVTEGVGKFAPSALKAAAENQYLKALKPTTGENKAIAQDIVPQMIQRGIHGSTEKMEEQAAAQANGLRPQLNAAYAAVPMQATHIQSPITSTLNDLESLKGKYVVDGAVMNPQAVGAINGIQAVVEQHANTISPQSLRKVKQIFDESVSEAGGYTNNDLTTNYSLKAQKAAANSIRDVLHQAAPDAAALDKEMSFWLDVQQVTRATNLRRAGQEGGLAKAFTPLASVLGGAAVGSSAGAEAGVGAAALTALGGLIARQMNTPAWRAGSALVKDRLGTALARGDIRMAAALAGRLGVQVPVSLVYGQSANRQTQSIQTPADQAQQ